MRPLFIFFENPFTIMSNSGSVDKELNITDQFLKEINIFEGEGAEFIYNVNFTLLYLKYIVLSNYFRGAFTIKYCLQIQMA
jgi:hypothetical protein